MAGQGRNVVALLAHGETARDTDKFNNLYFRTFKRAETKRGIGSRQLIGDEIPTLITVPDVNNLSSIRVVQPYQFPQVFGPGVTFLRATVSITRDRITRGIKKRLPLLVTRQQWPSYKMPLEFAPSRAMRNFG